MREDRYDILIDEEGNEVFVDEEGNPAQGDRVPFPNFEDYRKLMVLVPDALCSTRGGRFTEWLDPRPQPTYDEIEAVPDEAVAEMEEAEKDDRLEVKPKQMMIAMFHMYNMIRVREGKPKLSRRQFRGQLAKL